METGTIRAVWAPEKIMKADDQFIYEVILILYGPLWLPNKYPLASVSFKMPPVFERPSARLFFCSQKKAR